MGKIYTGIDEKLAAWIEQQHLFFVGSAPLAADGHVNVSPKGDLRWFRILGPNEVAYLDFVGSGAETIAHARENGRIVLMFCAFEGPPRILRLHGCGEVIPADDPRFAELFERAGFEAPHEVSEAQRAIVTVDVTRVADSCGYGVPLMSYEGERPHMEAWADKKMRVGGAAEIEAYVATKNTESIDGLPAFDAESQTTQA